MAMNVEIVRFVEICFGWFWDIVSVITICWDLEVVGASTL